MASALIIINVLSAVFTGILVLLLLILLGMSLKYIKDLTYKIGLILKAARQREENPDVLFNEEDQSSRPQDNGPSVEEVQEILDRMINQSKSTNFCKIFCFIMDRYNHLIVWPCNCRNRNKEYDLLKPPYRFYNFLNLVSVFILWQVIVFIISLIYIFYTSGISNLAIYYYVIVLVVSAFIASPITMLCIYAFYRIYVHNI